MFKTVIEMSKLGMAANSDKRFGDLAEDDELIKESKPTTIYQRIDKTRR